MKQREIRRTDTVREKDREGWAGRTKVMFDLNVLECGEAIAGPYFFGRAYEGPPEFTWSGTTNIQGLPPFLTIGINEWIQDEQGYYIGAYLWFKVRPPGGDGAWRNALYEVISPLTDPDDFNLVYFYFEEVGDPDDLVILLTDGDTFGTGGVAPVPGDYIVELHARGTMKAGADFESDEYTWPHFVRLEMFVWDIGSTVQNPVLERSWYMEMDYEGQVKPWGQSVTGLIRIPPEDQWFDWNAGNQHSPILEGEVFLDDSDDALAFSTYELTVDYASLRLIQIKGFDYTVDCTNVKLPATSLIPSFETAIAHMGGSPPTPGAIPVGYYATNQSELTWTDSSPYDGELDNIWLQTSPAFATISTTDPRSGTSHLELVVPTGSGGVVWVTPVTQWSCPEQWGSLFDRQPITNLMDGEQVTVTAWVKRVSGTGTFRMFATGKNHAGGWVGSVGTVSKSSFGSGYEQVSYTFSDPTHPAYILGFGGLTQPGSTTTFRIDDITVTQS